MPSHLFHMLFELFKVSIRGSDFAASVGFRFICMKLRPACWCWQNSMRATVELHEASREELPPVKAKLTLGKEDLSIKVSRTRQAALCLSRQPQRVAPATPQCVCPDQRPRRRSSTEEDRPPVSLHVLHRSHAESGAGSCPSGNNNMRFFVVLNPATRP